MNLKKKNVLDTFNLIAKDYVNYFGNDWEFLADINNFIDQIGENASVLDLGSGGGYITNYLSKKNINAIGIDFSSRMVQIAKETFPQNNFYEMDISEVSHYFKEDTFDGLISIYSLYFIPKKEMDNVLASFSRILKENGKFLIVTQCGNGEQFLDEDLMPEGKKKEALFVNLYTKEELKQLMEKHNFKVEEMFNVPNIDPNEIPGSGRLLVLASNNKQLKNIKNEERTR